MSSDGAQRQGESSEQPVSNDLSRSQKKEGRHSGHFGVLFNKLREGGRFGLFGRKKDGDVDREQGLEGSLNKPK